MKITDMTNEQLGYWCAKAQGWKNVIPEVTTDWVTKDSKHLAGED